MTTDSLNDWSTTPASNTNIAGTSIAIGCPPQDVGVFMRTVMAQIAYAVQGSGGAKPADWYVGNLHADNAAITTLTLDPSAAIIVGTVQADGVSADEIINSGIRMRFGSGTLSNGSVRVTFPGPFPTACLGGVATANVNGISGQIITIGNRNASQADFFGVQSDGQIPTSVPFFYIVWGN